MATWTGGTNSDIRSTNLQEQQLYDHILRCVQFEPPTRVIERFQTLFLEGPRYSQPEIWAALERIVIAKEAEENFQFVLNRCCHIAINRWQMQPQLQGAIPKLVELFENLPPASRHRSRAAKRLSELMQRFVETEQYVILRRLSQVVSSRHHNNGKGATSVGNLIQRYPYLYEHCLLGEDSGGEYLQTVQQIRTQVQQRFEFDLSQYVTYQVRLAQAMRQSSTATQQRKIYPVANPTLLSDRELGATVKHFVGKVQGSYTYRDIAQRFIAHTTQTTSYKAFKQDFYEYLTASIDLDYGQRQFNDRLYTHLQGTLRTWDAKKPTEFLILRTCSQLLNFLVVESSQRPDHFIFVDMTTNLGVIPTIGLLLKITLFCCKVKPYLEKRFAILFNHYELANRDGVPWLVQSLESLNVAFSIHFGAVDLSCLKCIM